MCLQKKEFVKRTYVALKEKALRFAISKIPAFLHLESLFHNNYSQKEVTIADPSQCLKSNIKKNPESARTRLQHFIGLLATNYSQLMDLGSGWVASVKCRPLFFTR